MKGPSFLFRLQPDRGQPRSGWRTLLASCHREMREGINPNDFVALVGAATNYLQELKDDTAQEIIQNALVQSPSDPEANYIMGEALVAKYKFSDAEPYLLRGLAATAQLIRAGRPNRSCLGGR